MIIIFKESYKANQYLCLPGLRLNDSELLSTNNINNIKLIVLNRRITFQPAQVKFQSSIKLDIAFDAEEINMLSLLALFMIYINMYLNSTDIGLKENQQFKIEPIYVISLRYFTTNSIRTPLYNIQI